MKENSDVQARPMQDDLQIYYGPKKKFITVCAGTGCRAYGSLKVKEALETELKKQNMNIDVLQPGVWGFAKKVL